MRHVAADVEDVCFLHWRVGVDALDDRLPAPLEPAARDGTGWVSVVAQRTRAVVGGVPLPSAFPQVALRTYVRPTDGREEAVGVHFLGIDAASRIAAAVGRRLFEVPYRRSGVTHRWNQGSIRIRVEADGEERLSATVEPRGTPDVLDLDPTDGWLTERYRYSLPDGRAGLVGHRPWTPSAAEVSVDADRLFGRAGLPEPARGPRCRYSPGLRIRLLERA